MSDKIKAAISEHEELEKIFEDLPPNSAMPQCVKLTGGTRLSPTFDKDSAAHSGRIKAAYRKGEHGCETVTIICENCGEEVPEDDAHYCDSCDAALCDHCICEDCENEVN